MPRPGHSLLAALVATTAVVTASLCWAGWRLLDQQRSIDDQRAREQLESGADAIAAVVRGRLAEAGERLTAWPAGPDAPPPTIDRAVVIAIGPDEVEVSPKGAVPYVPIDRHPPSFTTAFASIETVEFAAKRYPGARVHIIGLCSGAYHAFKAAVAGLPLSSIMVVNPLTFFWKPGMSLEYADFQITSETSRYARSSRSLSSWLKLLRGKVDLRNAGRVFWKRFQVRARNAMRDLQRLAGFKLQDDLASELQGIARQRIEINFIFSASDPGHSMLLEQGGRVVGKLVRGGKMRISIVQGADHTFTSHWNRDQLLALLAAHLDRHAGRG